MCPSPVYTSLYLPLQLVRYSLSCEGENVRLHSGKENAVLGGLQRLEMRSKLLVVKLHKSGEATQLSRIEQ